jgi:hypothetical protein
MEKEEREKAEEEEKIRLEQEFTKQNKIDEKKF